jgi:hypothetical protein
MGWKFASLHVDRMDPPPILVMSAGRFGPSRYHVHEAQPSLAESTGVGDDGGPAGGVARSRSSRL